MSWAAHNPEQYDEICRDGISSKLATNLAAYWNEIPSAEVLNQIVDVLQHEAPKVYDALVDWAFREIGEAERDYWGGLIDAAHERGKEAQ